MIIFALSQYYYIVSRLLTGNGSLNDGLVLSVEFVLLVSIERRDSNGDLVPNPDSILVEFCCPP